MKFVLSCLAVLWLSCRTLKSWELEMNNHLRSLHEEASSAGQKRGINFYLAYDEVACPIYSSKHQEWGHSALCWLNQVWCLSNYVNLLQYISFQMLCTINNNELDKWNQRFHLNYAHRWCSTWKTWLRKVTLLRLFSLENHAKEEKCMELRWAWQTSNFWGKITHLA